jgi:polysaccharide pyruvyl transferase WcaK-like protein
MTQNFALTRGYFAGSEQVHLPDVFPPFLNREVPRHHGVVACEGSMFKSKFANALTTMMVGALGIAAAENKLSVGYGAEAGEMDPLLRRLVARYCADSLIITRNEESRAVLRELNIPTESGTDTAWTFEPHPRAYAEPVLRAAGWDGRQPLLALCPIHPFWWPVKASALKYAARLLFGAYRESHYRTIYFHRSGREVDGAFRRYLDALAGAVRAFRARHSCFLFYVAMEQLDRRACRALAERLPAPVFASSDYTMYELVSLLRAADFLVSSRYHGIVTAMPAGVVSAGVTMDERIRNLMADRGHLHLLLDVDDPELEPKLLEVLETLRRDREEIAAGIARSVVRNLKRMARMGSYFEDAVERAYPEFPVRAGRFCWTDYLPPLSPTLRALVEQYESSAEETAPPAAIAARPASSG